MHAAIEKFVCDPGQLSAHAAFQLIRIAKSKKPKIKLWTSSRLLQLLGVNWESPESRPLLWRFDHVLRELMDQGKLIRRPEKQTSRNTREEWAYELKVDTETLLSASEPVDAS